LVGPKIIAKLQLLSNVRLGGTAYWEFLRPPKSSADSLTAGHKEDWLRSPYYPVGPKFWASVVMLLRLSEWQSMVPQTQQPGGRQTGEGWLEVDGTGCIWPCPGWGLFTGVAGLAVVSGWESSMSVCELPGVHEWLPIYKPRSIVILLMI